jgi:type 1 fimbriae regulatory protein FimE
MTAAEVGLPGMVPEAYLGHRNIQYTVRYTELASDRLKDFWH